MSNTDFPLVAEEPAYNDPFASTAGGPIAPAPRSERDDAGALPVQASPTEEPVSHDPFAGIDETHAGGPLHPYGSTATGGPLLPGAVPREKTPLERVFSSKLEEGLEHPARSAVAFAMAPGDYMQGKISAEEAQQAAIGGGVGLALGGPLGVEGDAATLGSGMMRRGRFGREPAYTQGPVDIEAAPLTVAGKDINIVKRPGEEDNQLVNVNVPRFDPAFAKDPNAYVGPGGAGGIGEGTPRARYDRFSDFLQDHGTIEAPTVYVGDDGQVTFGNGRHRYAVMRDAGVQDMPVSMQPESVANAEKFGYLTPSTPAEQPPPMGHNLPRSGNLPTLPEDEPPLYSQGKQGLIALPPDTHPQEKALNVNDILHPDNPAEPPRSKNVTDIAKQLNQRGQDALTAMGVPGGKITDPNNEFTNELLARSMAAEANAALQRPGANATDWYTGQVKKAMDIATHMYPELATDAEAKTAFQTALAVTSQGETVDSNSRLATQAYEYWRDHNRTFPTDMKAAGFDAKQAPSMQGNFAKYNQLVQDLGPDGAREFLNREFDAGDLAKMGYGDIDENVKTRVNGSAIFGSKIGGGFFQNLGGNYNPVTMDLWFMRNWGRNTGTLVGRPDTAKPYFRFLGNMLDPVHAEQMAGRAVPDNEEDTLQLAKDIESAHERDYIQNRAAYDADPGLKSQLTKSAIAYNHAVEGINEQPRSGGQREHIRAVVNRARDLMQSEYGKTLTNADLQAILWYPEKELYAKLGGTPSEGYNTDYATSLAELARVKGIPDDVIQSILRSTPGGSRSAAEAPVGGAAAARQQGGGGAAGQGAPPGSAGPTPAELTSPLTPGRPQASLEPHYGDPYAGIGYG